MAKTVLNQIKQKIKEYCETYPVGSESGAYKTGYIKAFQHMMVILEESLPFEKSMLEDAHRNGWDSCNSVERQSRVFINYYSQFTQDK